VHVVVVHGRRRAVGTWVLYISGIAAPLHALTANILGQRKLAGGCTAKDVQVTEAFVLKYGGESVHAAGTGVYGGTKLVVAALRALRGFNRPTDIDKQTRLIAKGVRRSVRNGPVYYKQPQLRHHHHPLTALPLRRLFGVPGRRRWGSTMGVRVLTGRFYPPIRLYRLCLLI
jgi:hypothetical protein